MLEPNKPIKVVMIFGSQLPKATNIINEFRRSKEIIFIGDGIKKISELDLSGITGQTNVDTLFIVYAHGVINIFADDFNNPHFIDDIETGSFLQKLQTTAGHKVTVDLSSCHGGGLLKRREINNNNICVLTEAGSKYPTVASQNVRSIIWSIHQKLDGGKTNQEIFSQIVGLRPETIYFKNIFRAESKSEKIAKTVYNKFTRPGKFNLNEIRQILEEAYKVRNGGAPEDIDKINADIQKFEGTGKSDFSLNKIKKILALTGENLTEIKEEQNSIESEFKKNLLEKFRENLQSKLTKEKIKSFLQERQGKFNEITGIQINSPTEIDYKNALSDFYFTAANRGYDEEIMAILKNYPDYIHLRDDSGDNILSIAAQYNHSKTVKALIGANVDLVDRYGKSILIFAARCGSLEVVKELIAAGINVNLVNGYKTTSLIQAAKSGHPEIIKELIAARANVNLVDEGGNTALMLAAQDGHLEIVKELINAGANVDLVNNNIGDTALTRAMQYGHLLVVKELIKATVNINLADKNGTTPLMEANRLEIVKELILAKANVDLVDKDGNTALMMASKRDDLEIVKELILAKANVDLVDKDGNTALTHAIIYGQYGNLKIAKELIEAGTKNAQMALSIALKIRKYITGADKKNSYDEIITLLSSIVEKDKEYPDNKVEIDAAPSEVNHVLKSRNSIDTKSEELPVAVHIKSTTPLNPQLKDKSKE